MPVFIVNADTRERFVEHLRSIYEKTLSIHSKEKDRSVDIKNFHDTLLSKEFNDTYVAVCMNILEKIRTSTAGSHSEECITRAVVDIFIKFVIDSDYVIMHSCCNTSDYVKLEFDILKDVSWKILETDRWGQWVHF
jgi:hypothetical protein